MPKRQRQNEPPSARDRRRELRQTATDPEQLVWALVRGRRLAGFKFRRQHSVGPFIADFACVEAKLIVEVDGLYHDMIAENDLRRQRYLEDAGYTVLRFTNDDVLNNLEGVRVALERTLGLPAEGETRKDGREK